MFSVGCVLALLHATMPAELLLITSELLLKGDRAPTQQPQDKETEGNNEGNMQFSKSPTKAFLAELLLPRPELLPPKPELLHSQRPGTHALAAPASQQASKQAS